MRSRGAILCFFFLGLFPKLEEQQRKSEKAVGSENDQGHSLRSPWIYVGTVPNCRSNCDPRVFLVPQGKQSNGDEESFTCGNRKVFH